MSAKIIVPRNGRYQPALAVCECGQEFYLEGDIMGECSCECGKVYNICGQRLVGYTQPFSGMNEYGEYYDSDY